MNVRRKNLTFKLRLLHTSGQRPRCRGGFGQHLGFASVKLGKLAEGGALLQARGRVWGELIFQDLFKKEA